MLIANNCIGAFTYKNNGIIYDNPFMWSRIFIHDFCDLIKNFEQIDFTDISIKTTSDYLSTYQLDAVEDLPVVHLAKRINIFYQHICPTYRKLEHDNNIAHMYVDNHLDYCRTKFIERSKRMNSKYSVVYMLNSDRRNENLSEIVNLITICNNKHIRLAILSNITDFIAFNNDTTSIICDEEINIKSIEYISKKYEKLLLSMI